MIHEVEGEGPYASACDIRVGFEGPQRVRGTFRVMLGLYVYCYIRLCVFLGLLLIVNS